MTKPLSDYITPRIAARMLSGMSLRRVQQMCEERVFQTAHKPGSGVNAHWKILRSDVLAHKANSHPKT